MSSPTRRSISGVPVTMTALSKLTVTLTTSSTFSVPLTAPTALASTALVTCGAVLSTVRATSFDSLALPASSVTTARKR